MFLCIHDPLVFPLASTNRRKWTRHQTESGGIVCRRVRKQEKSFVVLPFLTRPITSQICANANKQLFFNWLSICPSVCLPSTSAHTLLYSLLVYLSAYLLIAGWLYRLYLLWLPIALSQSRMGSRQGHNRPHKPPKSSTRVGHKVFNFY